MLSLDMLHPDSPEFIDIKMDKTKVTGANISLRQRDEFMRAVDAGDTEFTLRYPIDSPIETALYTRQVNPQELWHKITHNAWASAEPGNLFFDRIWEESIPNCYKDFGMHETSTNPLIEVAA
jgi:ribonucleoside-diphosphate reductase alpha chain